MLFRSMSSKISDSGDEKCQIDIINLYTNVSLDVTLDLVNEKLNKNSNILPEDVNKIMYY